MYRNEHKYTEMNRNVHTPYMELFETAEKKNNEACLLMQFLSGIRHKHIIYALGNDGIKSRIII